MTNKDIVTSDSAPVNSPTGFARSYDQRRLGVEPAAPFIGKAKAIEIYRARSVTAKRGNTAEVVWWVLFEIGKEGAWGNAPVFARDTDLFKQLQAVIGFNPADLGIDARHEFKLRPEVHVTNNNPYYKLQQICPPSPAEMIAALKAHADHVGALTAKNGYKVDQAIREYITMAQPPDFNGAWKAIADLTTPKEKADRATEIIAQQNAAAQAATNDPHYASPLTDEMVKHYQADSLVDDMVKKGAKEVAIEPTPPLPGNGGTGDMTYEELKRDEYGNPIPEHSTTDPDKMCFAIPKYMAREMGIDLKDIPKHVKAIFRTDVPHADRIREWGTAATWRMVEQYVARFKTQEDELTKKPAETDEKPQDAPAPVRPTIAEIDASKEKMRDYGIATLADFKAATGFENIPAAIDAGKTLKELEDAAWNWDMKKTDAVTAAKEAAGATEAKPEAVEAAKQNSPAPAEKPRSEPTNIIPLIKIQTLTGINIMNIQGELDKHLPPEAYQGIEYGQMKGYTDLDGNYVRERLDQVFGPMGIGWRIVPNAVAGRVEYKTEDRTNNKGEIKTWHVVSLVAHTFQYSLIMPDGSLSWTDASTTSDLHDNMDQQYAYRGAMTSIMKQFYSLMGGMNHIRHGEYTHVHAQRELAKQKAS